MKVFRYAFHDWKRKKNFFRYLKNRMWKKNQGWSDKYLSKEVREVSVKSVAQEIPTYCMSSILLPESLGEELERIVKKKKKILI